MLVVYILIKTPGLPEDHFIIPACSKKIGTYSQSQRIKRPLKFETLEHVIYDFIDDIYLTII